MKLSDLMEVLDEMRVIHGGDIEVTCVGVLEPLAEVGESAAAIKGKPFETTVETVTLEVRDKYFDRKRIRLMM